MFPILFDTSGTVVYKWCDKLFLTLNIKKIEEMVFDPESITNPSPVVIHDQNRHVAPSYLTDLLCPYTPSRNLCSSDANLLFTPLRTKHRTFGDKAFSGAMPPLLHDYTDLLKTHLFKSAFNLSLIVLMFSFTCFNCL